MRYKRVQKYLAGLQIDTNANIERTMSIAISFPNDQNLFDRAKTSG
jgi:hypothetical protein